MQVTKVVGLALAVGFLSTACLARDFNDDDVPYGADQSEVASALKNCERDETTIAICAWHRYIENMKAYRAAARSANRSLSTKYAVLLDQANAAFIAFRNATCRFESSGGGSIGFEMLYDCRSTYTKRRTVALKHFAECERTDQCERPHLLSSYDDGDLD